MSIKPTDWSNPDQFYKYKELSEDISYPQPEEWESRFDNAFAHNYLIADENIIEDVHKRIKSFIKTEIRKAEERSYNEAITDAIEVLPKIAEDNNDIELGKLRYRKEVLTVLEALKK